MLKQSFVTFVVLAVSVISACNRDNPPISAAQPAPSTPAKPEIIMEKTVANDPRSFHPTKDPSIQSFELPTDNDPRYGSRWISPPIVRESGQSFILANYLPEKSTKLTSFSQSGKFIFETVVSRKLDLVAGLSNGNLLLQSVRPFTTEIVSVTDQKFSTQSLYRPSNEMAYENSLFDYFDSSSRYQPVFRVIDDHSVMLDKLDNWHVVDPYGATSQFRGTEKLVGGLDSTERLIGDANGAFISFGDWENKSDETEKNEEKHSGLMVSYPGAPSESCMLSYDEIRQRLKIDPSYSVVPRFLKKTEEGKIVHSLSFIQNDSSGTGWSDRLLVFSSGKEICELARSWRRKDPLPQFDAGNLRLSYTNHIVHIAEANGTLLINSYGTKDDSFGHQLLFIDSKTLTLRQSVNLKSEMISANAWSNDRIVVVTRSGTQIFDTAGTLVKSFKLTSLTPTTLDDGSLLLAGMLSSHAVQIDSALQSKSFDLGKRSDSRVSELVNEREPFFPMALDCGFAVIGSDDQLTLSFVREGAIIKQLNLDEELMQKPKVLSDGSLLLMTYKHALIVAPRFWEN